MHNNPPTSYIKYFFIFVFIAAFISIIYRGIVMVGESAFKYSSFNVLFIDNDAYLVNVDKASNRTTKIKIPDGRREFVNKSRLAASIDIGVPLDARVIAKKDEMFPNFDNERFSVSNAFSIITGPLTYTYDNLNEVDLLKMAMCSRGVEEEKVKSITVNYKDLSKNEEIKKLFQDRNIFNNKDSLQIVNGTDIDGLGSRVSTMLENIGYNVVDVDSDSGDKSVIKAKDKNLPLVFRLHHFFNFPVEESSQSAISDVVIVLGEDIIKELE